MPQVRAHHRRGRTKNGGARQARWRARRLRRFGSAAPGLWPAHGVQSPIPSSAAALRDGVLDDGCKLLASIHTSIHLRTSNSPIFQALGNLTAYIPPSLILPLDLGTLYAAPSWCTLGASWAHLGRILGDLGVDFEGFQGRFGRVWGEIRTSK